MRARVRALVQTASIPRPFAFILDEPSRGVFTHGSFGRFRRSGEGGHYSLAHTIILNSHLIAHIRVLRLFFGVGGMLDRVIAKNGY